MMFRFPSVICTRCTGFFCLAIIKGPPNDIYCIIEEPYKHYFTEKVSYSRKTLHIYFLSERFTFQRHKIFYSLHSGLKLTTLGSDPNVHCRQLMSSMGQNFFHSLMLCNLYFPIYISLIFFTTVIIVFI